MSATRRTKLKTFAFDAVIYFVTTVAKTTSLAEKVMVKLSGSIRLLGVNSLERKHWIGEFSRTSRPCRNSLRKSLAILEMPNGDPSLARGTLTAQMGFFSKKDASTS
jgi:hypothetical protein